MKVFLSSTFCDLVRHREKAIEAIARLGHQGRHMEVFGARPEEPTEACLQEVDACDVFVGVYAHRYGFVPAGGESSITEIEYRRALERRKPILCFLVDESHPWPPDLVEGEPGRSRLRSLKRGLSDRLVCDRFTTPEDLGMKVGTSLAHHLVARSAREVDQVAAVCYRGRGQEAQVLLVKTSSGRWTFPKGGVDPGESPPAAAAREAHEEAGATGKPEEEPFTVYLHLKQDKKIRGREMKVAAYLLPVESTQDPLERDREPTWCGWADAERLLSQGRQFKYAEELRRVLLEARSRLR